MNDVDGFYFDVTMMRFVIGFSRPRDNFHFAYVSENADLIFYKSDDKYPDKLMHIPFDMGIEILLRGIQARKPLTYEDVIHGIHS